MALLSKPRAVLLVVIGRWERLSDAKDNRIRFILENRGPGAVFLSSAPGPPTDYQSGLRFAVGDRFIDEPPYVHCGEWWGMADAENTVVLVAEVGP